MWLTEHRPLYTIDGVVLTSIQLKNTVFKGDRLLWKKSLK